LWYPSQHLLRQNPLPRSQFGSPRRFPSAAHLGRFLQRLQLASNSAFAALTVGAWPSVRMPGGLARMLNSDHTQRWSARLPRSSSIRYGPSAIRRCRRCNPLSVDQSERRGLLAAYIIRSRGRRRWHASGQSHRERHHLPQSSSSSRLTAAQAGFLDLSQSGERP
jgi:hypothetical protein